MPEIFEFTSFVDPARLPVALMAILIVLLVGAVSGPMHGNANPFLWLLLNKTIFRFGGKLDRVQRKARDLRGRGLLFTLFILVCAYALGIALAYLVQIYPFYKLSEALFLSLMLTGGSVWFALLRLYFSLEKGKVSKGTYYTIAHSTRNDLVNSDDFGITRIGMGFAVRSFEKGMVAPVFWYLIGGLPAAVLYAALAALAWRFGKEGFTKAFGSTALALEKLAGFIPHLLSGLIVALAGLFTPKSGMTRALLAQMSGDKRIPYEQGGVVLTALAYTLNLSLGGPSVDLDGSAIKRPWVGPEKASAKVSASHLRRALYISLMAHILFVASLLGCMIWAG